MLQIVIRKVLAQGWHYREAVTLLTVTFQLGRLYFGRDDMYHFFFLLLLSSFMLDIKTREILYLTH